MSFARPELLWLLPIVVWFWRVSRGTRTTPVNTRAWRSVIALLIVLSAAGWQVGWVESPVALMFVLDRSHSVDRSQADLADRIRAFAPHMRPRDRAGLVVFGKTAAIERSLGPSVDARSVTAEIPASGTNIENALRVARTSLPPGQTRRLVLLSDGLQTSGDALAEAARAAIDHVRIDVVVPAQPSKSAARLEIGRVVAPPTARIGEPFAIAVIASAPPGTRGTIELRGSGGVQRQDVTVSASGAATVWFDERSPRAGTFVFEAAAQTSQGSDFGPEEPSAGAVVTVVGEPRVLYVGGSAEPVRTALGRAGFRVQPVASNALPRSAASLAEYDAIVLDDVRAADLDAPRAAALASHVEQRGGGLLVLGGPESLEPGVLAGTRLNELLPVDFRPRGGQRAPALALVIAFDKSGSMDDRVDGVPRIEFARQAVRRVFETVPSTDAVGVIAFDAAPHAVATLRPGQDVRSVTAALAAVQPGGGTAIAPALEMAAGWLRGSAVATSQRRHVLLVSDGLTSPADATRLTEIVSGGGFELSVVALGGERDRRFLESLSKSTGGRAYFPRDIRELPAIAARESARVAGGRLVEEPFRPQALPHPMLRGVDSSALPLLGGYVVGVAKPSAATAIQSPLNDPVLATSRHGLGRVAVYSADLHSGWSAALRSWPGVNTLFVQATRWVARRGEDQSLYTHFVEDGDGIRLLLEAESLERGLLVDLDANAVIRSPSGATTTVALSSTAPGRYETRFSPEERGAHVLAISAVSPDHQIDGQLIRGVYWSADAEYQRTSADVPALAAIAQITGGRVLNAGDDPFSGPRARQYFDVSPWTAGLALMMFLIEVLLLPLQRARWRRRDDDGAIATSHSAKRTAPTAAA